MRENLCACACKKRRNEEENRSSEIRNSSELTKLTSQIKVNKQREGISSSCFLYAFSHSTHTHVHKFTHTHNHDHTHANHNHSHTNTHNHTPGARSRSQKGLCRELAHGEARRTTAQSKANCRSRWTQTLVEYSSERSRKHRGLDSTG